MYISELIKVAIKSILSNKLRTFLTMLGIIIGIASVITIMSLGEGGQKAIVGEFEKIGVNIFSIRTRTDVQITESDRFTIKDVEMIRKRIPAVKYAAPVAQKFGLVKTENKTKRAFFIATDFDYGNVSNLKVVYGRFFNEKDILQGRNVVLIDKDSAKELFGYEDCVGKTIKVGSFSSFDTAKIIGVIDSGNFKILAGSASDQFPVIAAMPITYAQKIFDDVIISQIYVMTYNSDQLDEASSQAIRILEARHHNKDKYKTEKFVAFMEQFNRILGIFTTIMSAIAAISLLVGGIGVMNIMLVSVTERTREIGIRKAIGATQRDILIQFLIEALLISLIGGAIGTFSGYLFANLVGPFIQITPVVSLQSILIAFIFSSAVGIFFGIYPARRAAKLDPIVALRYE
ncbi:ABC transporter permease [Caldicellulosiruptor naganoensis]|uniref:ABC transporter permease n=1 Tax=Caldicellulosiruptor naganoensis TaxID=29324 RepID=A0ABY7BG90_9FIRM|nr:ABC transporter permease [Caldicellulosiruptor naganoensis]WAM31840.1 ABC transporter permease [Caldicellulosiruptor naganoensis]